MVEAATPVAVTRVALAEALGLTVAHPVHARATLPPWDNAAMDGYAVRSHDVRGASSTQPVELLVVGRVLAGADDLPRIAVGQACRIMTGAPMPPGADGVIRVEHTDAEAATTGRVRIHSDHDAGRNVRPGGQDMQAGDLMVAAGTRITPGWIAVLGAAGADPVEVYRRPVVAILTGGDELRPTHAFDDVAAGRAIPDSNAPMLAAAVTASGARALQLGPTRDDPDDLRRHLAAATEADLIIAVGGASMGEADLLKRTLQDDGFELDFWRARIRPGSPLAFGHLPGSSGARRIPLLSLPGNPASAFVTYFLFGHPFIRRLAGDPTPHLPVVTAVAGERLGSVKGLCHFHRVFFETDGDGERVARLAGPTNSGLVQTLGPAAGLAVVPEGVEALDAGEPVEVILIGADDCRRGPGFTALRP